MKKSRLKKQKRWKLFWDKLGFPIQKPKKLLKKFDNEKALRKTKREYGLTDPTVNSIRLGFNYLDDKKSKLDFICFKKFIDTHQSAIKLYYSDEDFNHTLPKLIKSLRKDGNDFTHIHYYNLWLRIGRGYNYNISLPKDGLKKLKRLRTGYFCPINFRSGLSYTEENKCLYKDMLLIIIRKGTKQNNKRLFVSVSSTENKIFFSVNVSGLERFLILKKLIKSKTSIDLNPKKGSFDKIINFIKNGPGTEDITLDLFGLTFEKKGVIYRIHEDIYGGKPQGLLYMPIKDIIPNPFSITNLREVEIYPNNSSRVPKIYRYKFNRSNEGVIYLNLISARLTKEEYDEAIGLFKGKFKISPEESYLNPEFTEKNWYKTFLDNPKGVKIPGVSLPLEGIKVYDKLQKEGLIKEKPKNEFGLVCFNKGCLKNGHIMWSSKGGKCCECKTQLWKLKEEINYEKSISGILDFVKRVCKKQRYIYTALDKQVDNVKLKLVKIFDKNTNEVTIAVTSNRKESRLIKELCKRCTNVMVLDAGGETDIIQEPVFFVKLGDLIYNYLISKTEDYFAKAIKDQAHKWDTKKVYSGDNSLSNLNKIHKSKQTGYHPYDFEIDCYNLINALLNNAIWLGFNESGRRLPDGLAELKQTTALSGCFMWDCKLSYSKNGADVGNYKKNHIYVKKLIDNPIIKKLGGLKSYLIISNNPDSKNFNRIFNRLHTKARGRIKKINYSFMDSRELVKIYNVFKQQSKVLEDNPLIKSKFYEDFNKLIIGSNVKIITSSEVDTFLNEIINLCNQTTNKPRFDQK